MNAFIENTALQIVGFAVTMNEEQINHAIDAIGDKVIAAVKDTDTKLDDAAADLIASALARLADRIRGAIEQTEVQQS